MRKELKNKADNIEINTTLSTPQQYTLIQSNGARKKENKRNSQDLY
jgi:hypothetical protein